MNQLKRPWLQTAPWQSVVSENQAICQAKESKHLPNASFDAARRIWEDAFDKPLTLDDALEVCRRCRDLQPFRFYNTNTFASIGKAIMDPLLKALPPVESQIVASTASHYVAGQISAREKEKVFLHFKHLGEQGGES
jgi:hypothetical protein